jgi:hypothetical protein
VTLSFPVPPHLAGALSFGYRQEIVVTTLLSTSAIRRLGLTDSEAVTDHGSIAVHAPFPLLRWQYKGIKPDSRGPHRRRRL